MRGIALSCSGMRENRRHDCNAFSEAVSHAAARDADAVYGKRAAGLASKRRLSTRVLGMGTRRAEPFAPIAYLRRPAESDEV